MNAITMRTVKDLQEGFQILVNQSGVNPRGTTALVKVTGKTGRRIRSNSKTVSKDARIEITFEPTQEEAKRDTLVQRVFAALYNLECQGSMRYIVLTWFLRNWMPANGFTEPQDVLQEALAYLITEGFVEKSMIPNPRKQDIPVAIIHVNRGKLLPHNDGSHN